MNIFDLISGKADYITLVKEFIYKVFVHEARKYHCKPKDLKIVIDCEGDNASDLRIMTYSNEGNRIERIIPDKEVQEILMK